MSRLDDIDSHIYVVRVGEYIYGPFTGYNDPTAADFIKALPAPWNKKARITVVHPIPKGGA